MKENTPFNSALEVLGITKEDYYFLKAIESSLTNKPLVSHWCYSYKSSFKLPEGVEARCEKCSNSSTETKYKKEVKKVKSEYLKSVYKKHGVKSAIAMMDAGFR